MSDGQHIIDFDHYCWRRPITFDHIQRYITPSSEDGYCNYSTYFLSTEDAWEWLLDSGVFDQAKEEEWILAHTTRTIALQPFFVEEDV